jgi:hypothetical protein
LFSLFFPVQNKYRYQDATAGGNEKGAPVPKPRPLPGLSGVVRRKGFEPLTLGLKGPCSAMLS